MPLQSLGAILYSTADLIIKRSGGIKVLICLAYFTVVHLCLIRVSLFYSPSYEYIFPFCFNISFWSHARKTTVFIVTLNSIFKDLRHADTLLIFCYFLNSLCVFFFLATSCSIISLNTQRDTFGAFVQVMIFRYVFLSYFFPAVHNYIDDFLTKPLLKV